jgi:hypothetical protein
MGLVSNERQLVLYENIKDDKKIVPLLVEKKYYMKFENSVVTQNVTRDYYGYNNLKTQNKDGCIIYHLISTFKALSIAM